MEKIKSEESKFAMVFSDVMMGVMGTFFVLVLFLRYVQDKGDGVYVNDNFIQLPPALRNLTSYPITRLRIVICFPGNTYGDQLVDAIYNTALDPIITYNQMGNCSFFIGLFPQGMGEGRTRLSLAKDINHPYTGYIHLMIGGYSSNIIELNNNSGGKANTNIAIIDFGNAEVVKIL